MIRQDQLSGIIDAQQKTFLNKSGKLEREALSKIPTLENFATIITGLRRCGKSTLLLQYMEKNHDHALYVNFEDIRLTSFEAVDFIRLKDELDKRGIRVLFLDEVQLVEKWEIFVHQLLNEGFGVFVTGSNASLLSKELGTHLTGRYLSMELFPFSYIEYLRFKNEEANEQTLEHYLKIGGMPEYVKSQQQQILINLIEDIVIRDIAVRYGIREVDALKQMLVYLLSNVGSPVSATKLTGMFGIRSSTTILDFFAFYSDSYLLEFIPQFSYSLKSQARNPKKVYAMDTGFVDAISLSSTDNKGRKLENLIFLHLRRSYNDIRFFKDKGECDFIAFSKGRPVELVQACWEVTDENFDRELNGLLAAMKFFEINQGSIITMSQADHFEIDGLIVDMIPAHIYLNR